MGFLASLVLTAARVLDRAAPIRWGILAAYTGMVTWLMLTPVPQAAKVLRLFPHIDKVLHFLLYGFLVMVFRWALATHYRPKTGVIVVLLGAIGYGVLMEAAQYMLVRHLRTFDLLDILSNSLGALCFWWFSEILAHCVAKAERQTAAATPTPNGAPENSRQISAGRNR